jgi:hypothetical protein
MMSLTNYWQNQTHQDSEKFIVSYIEKDTLTLR